MGCEFSDKVREAKRAIVGGVYAQLTIEQRKKFIMIYGDPFDMADNETYRAYYHCKRVLKIEITKD